MAKYLASSTFARVASDAVQLHGAVGCTGEHSVQRHFRDSKVMEIIEGASEVHQATIASSLYEVES
jgi:alkylation response protein AidB-like acyl-CoA dehydrogenase